ncbi:MAG: PTS sugar transporter subunit IIA [Candidatus Omnitrophota bacterium]
MQKLLTIKEVGDLLQVNQRTILRMIQNDKIPATKIGNQWRFHPIHLEKWVLNGGVDANGGMENAWELEEEFQVFSPSRVLLDLNAASAADALRKMADHLADEGHLLQRDIFYNALLEREKMSTTGVGRGVALPHAWHPINDLFRVPLVVAARLKQAVDFQAVDGLPVDLVFMLCSPRNRLHLKLLSAVNSIVREPFTLDLLRQAITPHEFVGVLTRMAPAIICG